MKSYAIFTASESYTLIATSPLDAAQQLEHLTVEILAIVECGFREALCSRLDLDPEQTSGVIEKATG